MFSASRSRSSSFRADAAKSAALVLAAICAGALAWSGDPRTLPLALTFPALWAYSPTRLVAGMVSAGYFLAASRGLPQGVVNFYGSGFGAGIGLWIAASLAFVFVHAVLWTLRPGWKSAFRYGTAAVLMSVPPFGIIGWAHPITAAGVLFPGWGWWGLAATALGLLAMTTRNWRAVVVVIGGFWIWSAATWSAPAAPEGWVGIDTQFGGALEQYSGYAQQLDTVSLVRAAATEGVRVVVLPESAFGMWTPTVERLWTGALKDLDVRVIGATILVRRHGYDNVMGEVSGDGAQVLYRERMPVPVSMWQPWLGLVGEGGGARAHFFANPIVTLDDLRVAPLICYEQLLVWPILQSALNAPDAIVAVGNGWWTTDTNIVEIQKANAAAWARLFDLSLVSVFNI